MKGLYCHGRSSGLQDDGSRFPSLERTLGERFAADSAHSKLVRVPNPDLIFIAVDALTPVGVVLAIDYELLWVEFILLSVKSEVVTVCCSQSKPRDVRST